MPPEDDADVPVARAVRPFMLTAGRTRPRVHLPIEATMRLLPAGRRAWPDTPQGRIARTCDGRSVAELSAYESLPIGVVRVLLGDLVSQGCVEVQQTLSASTSVDQRRALIERTLSGLRNI